MKNFQLSLFGLLASVFVLSGCGNIDIVKRRHMPGYHVEVIKKMKHEKPAADDAQIARAEQQFESIEQREAILAEQEAEQETLTASAEVKSPVLLKAERKAVRKEALDNAIDKTMTSFRHELAGSKAALKPALNRNTHWMAWVSFGAGLAAMLFGFIGLIVAFFGVTMWWLAILFGVTAIVFAIIHSKNNYQGETFRRLGLLFGIIGASLGLVGMLIWILRVVGVFKI
jgi:preprotein translocase subunit SecG